jgi:peptidoglycan/LPS O-acetylase OafA/YrhL
MSAEEFDFSRRIPQLDGLRGIAILTVLCFHYTVFTLRVDAPDAVNALLRGPVGLGWAGVDLFFVLSGFLIGGILIDARDSSNYFRTFYVRRVCRIFPLYFAVLAVSALAARLTGAGGGVPWKFSLAFLQNIWMARHNAVADPTWSLAVEEQFYFTLPALIFFVNPRRLLRVLTFGIVAAPLIRTALYLGVPGSATANFVLLPCRMDSLLIGVATACLLRRPQAQTVLRAHKREMWTVIEVFTLVSALFFLQGSRDSLLTNLVIYDSLALLFASVLTASLIDPSLAHALQAEWLMALGAIAYGVYLLHQLIFEIVLSLMPRIAHRGLVTACVATLVTIAVAKTSWELFEKPIVKLGHRAVYARRTNVERPAPMGSLVGVPFLGQEDRTQ